MTQHPSDLPNRPAGTPPDRSAGTKPGHPADTPRNHSADVPADPSVDTPTEGPATKRSSKPTGRQFLKWALLIAALFFFFAVIREAVDPYGDQPYVEITHGDHIHYVPRDRDPNVPIGQFPTRAPGPNERITPEGRIVPKDSLQQ